MSSIKKFKVSIEGETPLLMNSAERCMDDLSSAYQERVKLTKSRSKTEADKKRLNELECYMKFWVRWAGKVGIPTITADGLRTMIENASKKIREGSKVRSGLSVEHEVNLTWDRSLGKNIEELAKNVDIHYRTLVNLNKKRVWSVRPKFDKWGLEFIVRAHESFVDESFLKTIMEIAGSQIGCGDRRPEKSGSFGRFRLKSITAI